MNRVAIIVLVCVAPAFAQPKFSAPVIGIARDSSHQLRVVHGVPATFVLHDVIGKNVVNWAFDGNNGLAKTTAELLILGANGALVSRRPSPEHEAVLGTQGVFFPETDELWHVGPKSDAKVLVDPEMIAGKVIAIGPMKAQAMQFAVCRANVLWLLSVDSTNGAVTHESVPGGAIAAQACGSGAGSLLLLPGSMLLATGHAVIVQTSAGIEHSLPVSATHAARAGDDWIEVEGPGSPVRMIRIAADGERVYQLPAAKERR